MLDTSHIFVVESFENKFKHKLECFGSFNIFLGIFSFSRDKYIFLNF